ncbi:hypothetical protein FGO68_gene16629 [Halteria grandinella]|uniref:Uncharacterized protein n=1 Tax=Halteria grandinella TaxID=5974 RepID=A0A8J8NJG5_HALGN|nr:hypothetical protein FGO68_gene16629 [Halteria grandinella]
MNLITIIMLLRQKNQSKLFKMKQMKYEADIENCGIKQRGLRGNCNCLNAQMKFLLLMIYQSCSTSRVTFQAQSTWSHILSINLRNPLNILSNSKSQNWSNCNLLLTNSKRHLKIFITLLIWTLNILKKTMPL